MSYRLTRPGRASRSAFFPEEIPVPVSRRDRATPVAPSDFPARAHYPATHIHKANPPMPVAVAAWHDHVSRLLSRRNVLPGRECLQRVRATAAAQTALR